MDVHLPFLKAIIARPDDDLPRLIFADWLDENAVSGTERKCAVCDGDGYVDGGPYSHRCRTCNGIGTRHVPYSNGYTERAEFIRVQCRIATIEKTCGCGSCVGKRGGGQHHNGPCGVDRERDVIDAEGRSRQAFLRRREREIAARHWEKLIPDVDGLAKFCAAWPEDIGWLHKRAGETATPLRTQFRRGFVEHVTCTAADWLAHGDAICAATPVRGVTLTTVPEILDHGGRTRLHWDEKGLRRQWPQVKTWNLPRDPVVHGEGNDYPRGIIHAQPPR